MTTRKKTGPRSESGLLDQALQELAADARWEGWHLANREGLKASAACKDATRKRKAILERVRKLIRKGVKPRGSRYGVGQ